MDLEKMKQLENIRVTHKQISNEHLQLLISKKEELYKKGATEFTSFFEAKGFTVEKQPSKISASFKELSITAEIPNPRSNAPGASAILKISVSKPRKDFRVTVDEIGVHPRTILAETTIVPTIQGKVDETDEEIKKLSNEIEKIKNHRESLNKTNFGFTLYAEEKSRAMDKQFASMTELLGELFNK